MTLGLTCPVQSIDVCDQKHSKEQGPPLPRLEMRVDGFHPPYSGGLTTREDDPRVPLGRIARLFLVPILFILRERALRARLTVEEVSDPVHRCGLFE